MLLSYSNEGESLHPCETFTVIPRRRPSAHLAFPRHFPTTKMPPHISTHSYRPRLALDSHHRPHTDRRIQSPRSCPPRFHRRPRQQPFASARPLTSCARQRISKINPTFVVVRRGTNPPDENQLRLLPCLEKAGGFHRMRENLIRIVSAFFRNLVANSPDFGYNRAIFHITSPNQCYQERFSAS